MNKINYNRIIQSKYHSALDRNSN